MNEEKAVEEQSKPLVLEKLEADHADALLAQDEVAEAPLRCISKVAKA
ncbi:MAG: hypothetical protein OXI24_15700 [Candidatus Poribacteria bacterium]|nr:hypothetical protein [Candidatus Poribacteria bacterium]